MLNKACKPTLATQFDTLHKMDVRFSNEDQNVDFFCKTKSVNFITKSTNRLFDTNH